MTMGSQLQVQLIGVASTLVYTAILTYVILKLVDLMVGLRVDVEQETYGLDLSQHDERGYDL
jgi:Amt family ammonium transporter